MRKINIIGDLSKHNYDILPDKKVNDLFAEGYNITNLEAPIIEDLGKQVQKNGPLLYQNENIFDSLKTIKASHVSLCNNHILDYGISGLSNTINELNKIGVNHFGYTYQMESKSSIKISINGKDVIISTFSDYEFNKTKENEGAIIFDYRSVIENIKSWDNNVYKVCILHTGKERVNIPSPELVERTTLLLDLGFDLILCQHSHSMSEIYEYKNKYIIFGQGDFASNVSLNNYNTSYLVQLIMDNDIVVPTFFKLKNENGNLSLVEKVNYFKHIDNVRFYSLKSRQAFLDKIENEKNYYLSVLLNFGPIQKRLLKYFPKIVKKYQKRQVLRMLNILRSDTLKEMCTLILEELFDEE